MIKHALAVALLGMGIGFTGPAPVHAAPLPSGVAASSIRMADDTVVKIFGRCLDEVPLVSNVVAFFDLLSDEEYDCYRRYERDDYDRRTYDERKYPTYKDGWHAQQQDLKRLR
jgi:hypothetical protein